MTSIDYTAPFIGAIVIQVVHWYQLREKLELTRYKRQLRSLSYWVISTLMVVGGGYASLILADGKLDAPQLLLIGAAFPTLFTKLVSAGQQVGKETNLGAEKGSLLRDYFSPGR